MPVTSQSTRPYVVDKAVALLIMTCLLLPVFMLRTQPVSAQTVMRPTLRLGEPNVMKVGQTIKISIPNPGTGGPLDLSTVRLVSSAPSSVAVDGNSLVALQPTTENVQLLVRTRARRPTTLLRYEIQVTSAPPVSAVTSIAVEYDPPSRIVQPGGLLRVTATPKNSAGEVVRAKVKWTLEDPDESNYVEWAVNSNNQLLIFGKPENAAAGPRPSRLLFTAGYGNVRHKGHIDLRRDPAASQTHSISGRVTGDGDNIKDVTVTLKESGTPNVAMIQQTNDKGEFEFKNLAPGRSYSVTASKEKVVLSPAGQTFDILKGDVVSNFVAIKKEVPPPPPPSPFKSVGSRLDHVDHRTGADLFGAQTNKKYHINKLQLFNKLHELRDNRLVGDSIIVYSDSIKVPVNYEVKYIGPKKKKKDDKDKKDKKDKEVHAERREWQPKALIGMSSPDLTEPLNWEEWGKYKRPNNLPLGVKADPLCAQEPDFRSPYTFDQMLRTVDQRDAKEWRTVLSTLAQSSSSLATFFLSFIEPTGTSDARAIVQNFDGLLLPSFKERFPSKKDLHRESITREVMRASETIPFKQDMSRMVFLPKETWRNGEYEERISRVCLEPIEVEAVVAKPDDQLPINTIVGTVKNDIGELMDNVTVTVNGAGFNDSTQTLSNGVFTMQRLAPGNYVATVTASCGVQTSQGISVPFTDTASGGLTLTVPSRFRIEGTVSDNSESPLKGVSVALKNAGGIVRETVKTNTDGTYRFDCVPKGTYTVSMTHPQHSFNNVEVDNLANDRTLNITAKAATPAADTDEIPAPAPNPVADPPPTQPAEPTADPPTDESQNVSVALETNKENRPQQRQPQILPARRRSTTQIARRHP